jgi:prepilin-type N-terminal cleavage/methylation domain-containing protein/prepilin-type processing-associated H-X9-DG protein
MQVARLPAVRYSSGMAARDDSGKSRRRDPAFSLLELVVVLALLAILASLFVTATSGGASERRLQDCRKNVQRLFLALEIYATDQHGPFPTRAGARTAGEALDLLVPRYTADTASFICPATQTAPPPAGESIARHRISYAYYMGRRQGPPAAALLSDAQVDATSKPAGAIVFSATGAAPGNNHGQRGGNVVFTDGHAESSPPRAAFSLVCPPGVVLLNP